MEPAATVASTIGTVIVLIFMVVVCYGAFLIVRDKERDWKARYGNRWIVSPSERVRLDKEYEAAQKAKRAEDSEDDEDEV